MNHILLDIVQSVYTYEVYCRISKAKYDHKIKRYNIMSNQLRFLKQSMSVLIISIVLYACSAGDNLLETTGSTTIQGNVLTFQTHQKPLLSQVFLDANQNFQLDENELVVNASPETGQFELEMKNLNQRPIASLYLVAKQTEIGQETYFASPLAAYVIPTSDDQYKTLHALISPLTSLVVSEILVNHLSLVQAQESVSAIAKNINVLFWNKQRHQLSIHQVIEQIRPNWQSIKNNDSVTALDNLLSNSQVAKFNLTQATYNPHHTTELADEIIRQDPPSDLIPISSDKKMVVILKSNLGNLNHLNTANESVDAQTFSLQQIQAAAQNLLIPFQAQATEVFTNVVQGFSTNISSQNIDQFLEQTLNNPLVDKVVEDTPIFINNTLTQTNPSWGLDRLDQFSLPLSSSYQYQQDGTGVNAYVMDTGIRASHVEFTKRVLPGFSAIADGKGTQDCMGHGSHVAGILGGTTYGVAKNIHITPVRVLDCKGGGSLSSLLAGFDWIMKYGKLPAVINMSIGGNPSDVLDYAVSNAVKAGFVVVTSAGNNSDDSCLQSPARNYEVINVGSSDIHDAKSYFSNYGQCVDLFAPGSGIISSWWNSDTETRELSGTSMSAPFVAGVAALYLQNYPKASPLEVRNALYNSASSNQLKGYIGNQSPNRLLSITPELNFAATEKPIYIAPIVIQFRMVYIASITHTKVKVSSSSWRTIITIKMNATNDGTLRQANIVGGFSVGGKNLSCTTDVMGVCSISSGLISKSKTFTTFTVNDIAGERLLYFKKGNKINSVKITRPVK